jgi:acetyl-CoA synthetase
MFEGVPTYPDAGRFWDVVDKYKVTQFYTAPTAIRALMREGDEWSQVRPVVAASPRLGRRADQPRGLDVVLQARRQGKCPIVDTWWQTETGGILITPLPAPHPQARLGHVRRSSASSRSSSTTTGNRVYRGRTKAASCASSRPGPA